MAETTLTAPVIIAFGAAAAVVIGAIFAGVVTLIKAFSDLRRDLVTVRTDTESIKGHVNSEKTASEGRENALRLENGLLREIIADKKATAGLLAQAVASRIRSEDSKTEAP